MASRPKSKPAAKSVLGNDPFLRGAAPAAPAPVPLAQREEPKTIGVAKFQPSRPQTQPATQAAARPETAPPSPRAEPKTISVTRFETARPATKRERPVPRASISRAETAASARPKTAPTRKLPVTDPPAAARPKSVPTRKLDKLPKPVASPPSPPDGEGAGGRGFRAPDGEGAGSSRPRTLTYEEAAARAPSPPPAREQALVKHVLVPEIESDEPKAPPPEPTPEPQRKPGALAQLMEVAQEQAQSLLGAVVKSPAAMQLAGAAISGATAVRALAVRPSGLRTVDDFGEDPALVARTAPALDFLYDHYFRVRVEGAENLPRHGPFLSIANHAGALPLDGPILRAALERSRPGIRARWLVEDALFHAPFVGTWLNRIGAVRACPENAQRLLEGGAALAVFPEGVNALTKTFRRRYQLQRFGRGGFVKLALRSGAPLVPTAIVGAEESMPVLATLSAPGLNLPVLPLTPSLVPLPTRWTLVFLPPIDLSKHGPDDAQDLGLVQRVTEEVRGAIGQAIDRVRAQRRSVFLG